MCIPPAIVRFDVTMDENLSSMDGSNYKIQQQCTILLRSLSCTFFYIFESICPNLSNLRWRFSISEPSMLKLQMPARDVYFGSWLGAPQGSFSGGCDLSQYVTHWQTDRGSTSLFWDSTKICQWLEKTDENFLFLNL